MPQNRDSTTVIEITDRFLQRRYVFRLPGFEDATEPCLIELLAAGAAVQPDNLELLQDLALLLSRAGRIVEGLAVDRRIVDLAPDSPDSVYNLACSLALAGCEDEALAALKRALDLGFDNRTLLNEDQDLASLRCAPFHERFQTLIAGFFPPDNDPDDEAKAAEGLDELLELADDWEAEDDDDDEQE